MSRQMTRSRLSLHLYLPQDFSQKSPHVRPKICAPPTTNAIKPLPHVAARAKVVDLDMVRALPDVTFEEDAEDALLDVAVLAVELVALLLAEALGVNTTWKRRNSFFSSTRNFPLYRQDPRLTSPCRLLSET